MGQPFNKAVNESASISVEKRVDKTTQPSGTKDGVFAAPFRGLAGDFEPRRVNFDSFKEIYGLPMTPGLEAPYGLGVEAWEGQRQILEGLKEGDAIVCRVHGKVAAATSFADRYTLVKFNTTAVTTAYEEWDVSPEDHLAGDATNYLLFYIRNGDYRKSYQITIANPDAANETVELTIGEGSFLSASPTKTYGPYIVGFKPDLVDASGDSLYVDDVLKASDCPVRAEVDPTYWDYDFILVEESSGGAGDGVFMGSSIYQTGTSPGEMASAVEWDEAISKLDDFSLDYDYLITAGCPEIAGIQRLQDLAEKRLTQLFIDVPRTILTYTDAVDWLKTTLASPSDQSQAAWRPIRYTDQWSGRRIVTGGSGSYVASKIRGRKQGTTTAGVHYSPAGTKRGEIDLAEPEMLATIDDTALVELAKGRVNPYVIDGGSGSPYLFDSLTMNFMNNDSRFTHVVDVMNWIELQCVKIAASVQHDPNGVTRDEIVRQADKLFAKADAGGLLTDPEEGGARWSYTLEAASKDLWELQPTVCITGTARRIAIKSTMVG